MHKWGSLRQRIMYRETLTRLRAYNALRFSQGEKPVFDFINYLAEHTFLLDSSFFRGFVPAGYEERTTLAFRQKLLRTTLDHDLGPGVMMMAAGKAVSPFLARLPAVWRKALSAQGLVIHWVSPLLWLYVVLQKFKEAVSVYRHGCTSRAGIGPAGPYALLMGLPPRAYTGSLQDDDRPYINFLSWFRQRYVQLDLRVVRGDVPTAALKPGIFFQKDLWPALTDADSYRAFRKQGRQILGRALWALLRGRWEYAFMARDVIELQYVRALAKSDLPARVAITNSHYVNRPLWSYYLEECGIETGLYFYSTNTFNIDLRQGGYGLVYGYNLMSWSHYYTATPEHAAFLQQASPYPKTVHVVGTIPLEDNGMPLPEKKRPAVAYFDVQPFRDAFMASIGRPTPLYNFEASRRNIDNILAVCKRHGYDLFIKPKRDVGNRLCPRYRRYIEMLARQGDIHIIDSYIAADRVVEWADAVVCQPFTSVAIVATEYHRPAVYYDGLKLVQKEQPAAQGVEVIQELEELSSWLARVDRVRSDAQVK